MINKTNHRTESLSDQTQLNPVFSSNRQTTLLILSIILTHSSPHHTPLYYQYAIAFHPQIIHHHCCSQCHLSTYHPYTIASSNRPFPIEPNHTCYLCAKKTTLKTGNSPNTVDTKQKLTEHMSSNRDCNFWTAFVPPAWRNKGKFKWTKDCNRNNEV